MIEQVTLPVKQLYTAKAYIFGHFEDNLQIIGFVNEKTSESAKRALTKIGRQIQEELDPINEQRRSILSSDDSEEDKKAKDEEILNDTITLSVEKIDFKKVADDKFAFNYQFLYDKFFKD